MKGLRVDFRFRTPSSVAKVCVGRVRMHSIPSEITTAMNTVHPMRVVRGPNRSKRRANMGDRAAEAMFAEPKLQSSESCSHKTLQTYKMPFARPRRWKNHSSTKLIQGAKRRPLEKPYIKP